MARVLVVDDAAFMRKMVSDALTKGGHEVVGEAGNGAEAVDPLPGAAPEVTTLDITMPEKDGLSALKEIIALDPAARVIMCSALGPGVQGARVDQARRQGLRRQALQAIAPHREGLAKSHHPPEGPHKRPPLDQIALPELGTQVGGVPPGPRHFTPTAA